LRRERAVSRLTHIKTAIQDIYNLLEGKSLVTLRTEKATRAAFERFLEIISEASRHVPDEWKAAYPTIAWQDVASIGNRFRHAYDDIDPAIIWDIYKFDLESLEAAVDKMIDDHSRDSNA
jgi:uncharacterized protein with HEPN domain